MADLKNQDADIILVVDGEEIKCQREMLLKKSDYFKAMFSSNMKESHACVIPMRDVSAECMKWLVNYSHDLEQKRLAFTDVSQACQVLHTACMLQFQTFISKICKYLLARITVHNCLQIMCLADLHALNELYNFSRRKALWEFRVVVTTNDFLELNYSAIVDYLSDDHLHAVCEREVAECIIKWTEYDRDNRLECCPVVFSKCVRSKDISIHDKDNILSNEIFKDDSSLVEEITSHLKNTAEYNSRLIPKHLWLTGVWSPQPDIVQSKIVCVYGSLDGERLQLLDNLPINCTNAVGQQRAMERIGFSVTVVGKDIYIFGGGTLSGKWNHDCWKYDSFKETWTEIGDIPNPRRQHSTVVLNDRQIVLIGGFGKYRVVLDTCQAYDTVTGEWCELPKLNFAVYSAAACTCQDHIYVIKHNIERLSINSGEEWHTLKAALPFEIGLFSAVSIQEKIYILGKNICTLVCFDTSSLTFDTLSTFQPFVQRYEPVLCLKDTDTLLIVSGQDKNKKGESGVRTVIEEFSVHEQKVVKDKELDWVLTNPHVITVPYFPKFR